MDWRLLRNLFGHDTDLERFLFFIFKIPSRSSVLSLSAGSSLQHFYHRLLHYLT